MNNLICVTDWEEVDKDDFYLQEDWLNENFDGEKLKEVKETIETETLYLGYIVEAKNYCIFKIMDAQQIIIDRNFNEIIPCESSIIGNSHKEKIIWE